MYACMHACIHLYICVYIYITYHIVIYSTCTPSFVHAWLHDMSEEPTAWAMEWKRRAFMQVFPRTYPKSSKGTINFGTSASCWHNIDGYPNKRQIIRMPYAHMWYIKMHKRKHLESSPTLTVTLDAKKTTMPLSWYPLLWGATHQNSGSTSLFRRSG